MALALIVALILGLVLMSDQPSPTSKKMTRPEFHAQFAEEAKRVEWRGIPWRFALAVADLETGFGNNKLTREARNIFSLKTGSGWTQPGGWDGKASITAGDGGAFRVYQTWAQSMTDFVRLIHYPRYAAALTAALAGDFKGFAVGLKAGGYDASLPTYAKALESRYQTIGVA